MVRASQALGPLLVGRAGKGGWGSRDVLSACARRYYTQFFFFQAKPAARGRLSFWVRKYGNRSLRTASPVVGLGVVRVKQFAHPFAFARSMQVFEFDAENAGCVELEQPAPVEFEHLPSEILTLVLDELPAVTLALLGGCSKKWHQAVPLSAHQRLNHLLPMACGIPCSRPLRALACVEALIAEIQIPPERAWRDEWVHGRIQQARLLAKAGGDARLQAFENQIQELGEDFVRAFFAEGNGSIGVEAEVSYCTSISWKVQQRGWSESHALAGSLLASRCGGALSAHLQGRLPGLNSSCWALCSVLWQQSWRLLPVARSIDSPKQMMDDAEHNILLTACYANIDGQLGLATEDESWEALRRTANAPTGLSFSTRGFCFAMVANERSFPDGQGYRMPVTGDGRVDYELSSNPRSGIVRFLQAPPDASSCRSLVPTDDGIFRLPPFATITLVRVYDPLEWVARPPEGPPIAQRCYEVTVAF